MVLHWRRSLHNNRYVFSVPIPVPSSSPSPSPCAAQPRTSFIEPFILPKSLDPAIYSKLRLTAVPKAKLIKHLIKAPRPPPPAFSTPSQVRPKQTYGMPSTHSTALSFYLAYLIPLLPSLSHHLTIPVKIMQLLVLAYWLAGVWSRVALGYHTFPQVIGGIVLGCTMAVGWKRVWFSSPTLRSLGQRMIDEVCARTLDRM